MKSSRAIVVFAGLFASTVVLGCSSYRVVQRTPDGGIVALLGDRDAAREKAEQYMAAQCPGGFDIVEEGEAVTGTTTQQQSTAGRTVFGAPAVNTSATTQNTTEWRVKYRCKSAGGGAPTDKASTPSGGNQPESSRIHELVIRF